MINNLKIEGFKSFVEQDIALSNITLLAGLNNSGKSSVIQCLRMYAAAYNNHTPLLKGHGEIEDLRSDFVSAKKDIKIAMHFTDKKSEMVISNHKSSVPVVCPEFLYVGADRLGPQNFLPLNISLDVSPKVGDRGEYTLDLIEKLSKYGYLVPEKISHDAVPGQLFEYALRGWLTEIAPGIEFNFSTNKKAGISHAEIDSYRPTNVGFGLSYTLPIIAATLCAVAKAPTLDDQDEWVKDWEAKKNKNGILLVIENPEAHLHPRGQTAMGKLLALAASCGVQIVIETHSEHVIDGIRIAVYNNLLSSSKVIFHYLAKDEFGKTQIKTPTLDENGKLDFWPEGFFDQALKNKAILSKRKK